MGTSSGDDSTTLMSSTDQIILEEVMLVDSAQGYNQILKYLCKISPEISQLVDDCGRLAFIDFIIDPGGIENYWKRVQTLNQIELEEERFDLYSTLKEAHSLMEAAVDHFLVLHLRTKEMSSPPQIIQDWSGESYWLDHGGAWGLAVRLPIRNRLLVLHHCESFNLAETTPPDCKFIEYLERQTSKTKIGRPANREQWRSRKKLVVELLLDSNKTYDSIDDLFLDLIIRDDNWEGGRSSPRNYFKDRLKERRPTTLDEWIKLAQWWERTMEVPVEPDWIPPLHR